MFSRNGLFSLFYISLKNIRVKKVMSLSKLLSSTKYYVTRHHTTSLSSVLCLPHTYTVGPLVPPKVESLIVTQWDYLKTACGLLNAQNIKRWAAACSQRKKSEVHTAWPDTTNEIFTSCFSISKGLAYSSFYPGSVTVWILTLFFFLYSIIIESLLIDRLPW